METYNELTQFDRDFKPAEGGPKKPGLDTLADGDYEFEITNAELVRTPEQKELILRVDLFVPSLSSMVEKVYFFRTQQNVDYLGLDLVTLGFDADQWKPPSRVFSQELPKALPRLKGVRFKGKKVTTPNSKDANKPYHNLYINQKVGNGSTVARPGVPANHSPAADPVPW